MSTRFENPLEYRSLYESPLISVRDYLCCATRGGPGAEEDSDGNHIVLMRRGAFCKHFGRRSVTADVNQVVFFSRGSTYRVSHPADCGDRGTVFVPSPRVLNEIVRELDPGADDRPDRPFPFVTGPCDSSVFWRHRELVERISPLARDWDPSNLGDGVGETFGRARRRGLETRADRLSGCRRRTSSGESGETRADRSQPDPLEPLWADVTALQLVADVLEAAFAHHGMPRKVRRRRGTDADHIDLTEAAKTYLASRLSERITLDELARAVHASPFHLARIFQQRTGVPVHRYLTRLRLRASLDRLAGGAGDLTTLALDLGFSSHSHFADAFRREFGRTPSEVRRDCGRRAFAELSKNLEV